MLFTSLAHFVIITLMNNLISIAKILNFHGIQGEAKVGYTKGKEAQIQSLKSVQTKNGTLNIEKLRFHKGVAIVKFSEINSIDELMPYKGQNLYIEKEDVKKQLEKEEYLVSDLVGMKVFDNKEDYIGEIASVGDNSATNLLCIKPQDPKKKEILVPFVKELVPIVDIKGKKVIIKPIEGLLES